MILNRETFSLFLIIFCFVFTFSVSAENKYPENKVIARDTVSNSLFWDFNTWNNEEAWLVPEPINGGVIGGAIWITIESVQLKQKMDSWAYQIWGTNPKYDIESPKGLNVKASDFNEIRMRIRNLSPETDGEIFWRTVTDTEKDAGRARYSMKPDCSEWQEIVCYPEKTWDGTIDQIRIRPAQMWMRGDIWIDWIKISKGNPKPQSPRPDLCSTDLVPKIKIPGITQENFQDAFNVLDECLVTDVPMKGFNYPFLAPGGKYGQSWWQLDASLNIAGAKWVNQEFVEDMMYGFAGVQSQNPDGRIDLWGGAPVRGLPGNVSSLPRFFEAAFDIATRTDDGQLQKLILDMMKKYLGYWFSPVKRDAGSGLITAVFEESFSDESFGDKNAEPGTLAPVDLNVAVAIGCYNTARLAKYLGFQKDEQFYDKLFGQICNSINKYLWNEEKGAYFNYNVRNKQRVSRFICTTFDPFCLNIASKQQVEKLIPVLTNPELFNWGIRPLTTIAKTEPGYMEATGIYDGKAWFGDVWTLRNLLITDGLEDIGKHDLASELAWSTIKTFNSKYCEYIVPSTGSGEGEQRYGWSASQYIQAIIEHLFGINYNSFEKRLRIMPHIPNELLNQEIEINNLKIPSTNELRLNLKILKKEDGKAVISIKLNGKFSSQEMLEVFLPVAEGKQIIIKDEKGKKYQPEMQLNGLANVAGIRIEMKKNVVVVIE